VAQVYQFVDDLYKLIGNHSLQFGYEYHQNSLNFFDLEAPQGVILSNGIYSNTQGFGVADYLMGDAYEAIYETALKVNNYIRGNSVYGQDTWRVTPKLTVNYGVRYELYPPFWLERNNRTSNFSAANGGEIVTATGNNGLYGRTLIHPDNLNFSPRVGFAYHASGLWSSAEGTASFISSSTESGRNRCCSLIHPSCSILPSLNPRAAPPRFSSSRMDFQRRS
jgi:outer membrane receptor protein involved in Fe transport